MTNICQVLWQILKFAGRVRLTEILFSNIFKSWYHFFKTFTFPVKLSSIPKYLSKNFCFVGWWKLIHSKLFFPKWSFSDFKCFLFLKIIGFFLENYREDFILLDLVCDMCFCFLPNRYFLYLQLREDIVTGRFVSFFSYKFIVT